jgi:hypothetical protein
VEALKLLLRGLQEYVTTHHAHGLAWGSRKNASSAKRVSTHDQQVAAALHLHAMQPCAHAAPPEGRNWVAQPHLRNPSCATHLAQPLQDGLRNPSAPNPLTWPQPLVSPERSDGMSDCIFLGIFSPKKIQSDTYALPGTACTERTRTTDTRTIDTYIDTYIDTRTTDTRTIDTHTIDTYTDTRTTDTRTIDTHTIDTYTDTRTTDTRTLDTRRKADGLLCAHTIRCTARPLGIILRILAPRDSRHDLEGFRRLACPSSLTRVPCTRVLVLGTETSIVLMLFF